MSEPEWSLPMNRTELIARCEALAAELVEVKNHDAAATSFVQDMVNALGWQERPDGTVSLDDLRDEVLHWLSQVKPTAQETGPDLSKLTMAELNAFMHDARRRIEAATKETGVDPTPEHQLKQGIRSGFVTDRAGK